MQESTSDESIVFELLLLLPAGDCGSCFNAGSFFGGVCLTLGDAEVDAVAAVEEADSVFVGVVSDALPVDVVEAASDVFDLLVSFSSALPTATAIEECSSSVESSGSMRLVSTDEGGFVILLTFPEVTGLHSKLA